VRPREIQTAAEAAEGLRPFGQYAYLLFSAGLSTLLFSRPAFCRSPPLLGVRRAGFEAASTSAAGSADLYSLYTLLIVAGAGL
jgi:hypothetical protein